MGNKHLLHDSKICLVLSFGDLSVLEISTFLEEKLQSIRKVCDRIAIAETKESTKLEEIYGIHKAAYPVIALKQKELLLSLISYIPSNPEEKLKISLSLYCSSDKELYESVLSELISSFRQYEYKHVKVLRQMEVKSDYIARKHVTDFVTFLDSGQAYIALTQFLPNTSYIQHHISNLAYKDSRISLSPRLARTLVNIANPRRKGIVLDPFCGTGTILVEALSLGMRCIGSDISKERVIQTKKNILKLFPDSENRFRLFVSDVTNLKDRLEGKSISSIVTEPILLPTFKARPSKKIASQLLENSKAIYTELLTLSDKVLEKGGILTIVVPLIPTLDGGEATIKLSTEGTRLINFETERFKPVYPIRLPFESTRYVKRAIYAFKAT